MNKHQKEILDRAQAADAKRDAWREQHGWKLPEDLLQEWQKANDDYNKAFMPALTMAMYQGDWSKK